MQMQWQTMREGGTHRREIWYDDWSHCCTSIIWLEDEGSHFILKQNQIYYFVLKGIFQINYSIII